MPIQRRPTTIRPPRGVVVATAIVLFAICASLPRAEDAAEPLYAQAGRLVFRLEHKEVVARPGQPTPESRLVPDGTAFVLGHRGRLFLVTARHVAERAYDLRARVPSKRDDDGAIEVVELRIPQSSWVFHKDGPEIVGGSSGEVRLQGVDVAVALLPGIRDRGIIKFLSCTDCPDGEENQLGLTDPEPPQSVLIAGFPGSIGFTLKEQRPMFRAGIIAMVAGEQFLLVDGAYADKKSFVIDGKIERGNSGSPIFSVNQFSGDITLVGMVSAANQDSDFGIGIPASRIRETLERALEESPSGAPTWHLLEEQAQAN